MLNERGVAKVVDFGFSRLQAASSMTGFRGTPVYMSPEIMRYSSRYDSRIDVFSFGILLWEMCSGVFPWSTQTIDSVISIQQVLHCVSKAKIHLPITNEMRKRFPMFIPLIESCWDYDPKRRPYFTEVLQSLDEIAKLVPKPDSVNNLCQLEFFHKDPLLMKKPPKPEDSPFLPKSLFTKSIQNTPQNRHDPPYMIAQSFWVTQFDHQGNKYRPIPIGEFYKKFLSTHFAKLRTSEPEVVQNLKNQMNHSNVYLLCWSLIQREKSNKYKPCGNDFVTLDSYTDFLSCWGGFGNPLVNCIATFSRRMFYGCISWSETMTILQNKSVGSFILRLSRKSPHKIGIAFVREKQTGTEITQSLVDLEDVLPGWDDYLVSRPMFLYPVKYSKTNAFPSLYKELLSIHNDL